MTDTERPIDQGDDRQSEKDAAAQREDVRAGKGRVDEVGHTGIYPASAASVAPPDAETRAPGELGHVTPGKEALTVIPKDSEPDKR